MTPPKQRFPKDDEMDDFLTDNGNEDVVPEIEDNHLIIEEQIEMKGGTFTAGRTSDGGTFGMFMPNDIMRNPDGTAMITRDDTKIFPPPPCPTFVKREEQEETPYEDIIFEEQEKEMKSINNHFERANEEIYESRKVDNG